MPKLLASPSHATVLDKLPTPTSSRFPPPHVTDAAASPFGSMLDVVRDCWRRPQENLGVVCILTLCFVGFVVTHHSSRHAPQVVIPTDHPMSVSTLDLLVAEIHALRAQVAELRALVVRAPAQSCPNSGGV
ncbi:Aste57867_11897 [Aphanomyces stellatus]|uniref:Aste57867_11897 protein n=1 Tax=Aphanomyces stellatus TaxID=120398 RepID=A0A485KUL0_9STRA|nr:hypothetical protein As57867_011852 [Aphanomyces stellatus]VFT88752.1 Aste57867_11897 [Aphanomyces stellatus]